MMQPPYRYRAYGLIIRSDLEMPELESVVAEQPDLIIRLSKVGRSLPALSQGALCVYGADAQYLAWPGVGGFLIRGTREIDIEPAPGVSIPLLNFPLLGPVMALLLHLRGMLVLHASAINVAGRSVIFLGARGAGKSTTAAALVAAGHQLLVDDVVAIDLSISGDPRIVPGFPTVKLTEVVAAKIVLDAAVSIPPPIPDFPKRQRRLAALSLHSYVPLSCIYVLARGPSASKGLLSAVDALTAIMRFSILPLSQQRPLSDKEAGIHLKQCAVLVGSVRAYRLEVPNDLDRLDEVVRLVVESSLS
jgi:hypothetical protein